MPEVKKLPYKIFKYIYTQVPRLCVDIIVKTNKGIILTKRSIPPAKGWWHIPGGTILWGENIKQAVKRVAMEELGIQVRITKFIGVFEHASTTGFGQPITLAHEVKITSGSVEKNNEALDLDYFKAIPRKTLPEQAKMLKDEYKMKRL